MLRIYSRDDLIRYQSYAPSICGAKSHELLDHPDITLANLARVFVWDNQDWAAYLTDEPYRLGK